MESETSVVEPNVSWALEISANDLFICGDCGSLEYIRSFENALLSSFLNLLFIYYKSDFYFSNFDFNGPS